MEIHQSETKKERKILSKEMGLKVFATVGLFVILIIIIFGAALTVNYAGKGLTAAVTLLTGQSPLEEVIPKTNITKVTSGEAFEMSWDHKEKAKNGSYSLYYPCVDDVFITVQTLDEGKKTALCNKQFDFVNRNNELKLIASNAGEEIVKLPISISFTPNGESEATITGVVAIEVAPGKVVEGVAKDSSTNTETKTTEVIRYIPIQTLPSTNVTYPVSGGTRISNPNGFPDLRANLLEVGVLNSSNQFTRTDTLRRSDYKIAVRFRIENIGDKTSDPYRFNAYLPTYPAQTYNSDVKPGLQPGEYVDYTLGFDRPVEGNTAVRIQVDGGNYIIESSEINNELVIGLRVL